MKLQLDNSWINNESLIISGPCSAETEEQVFSIAEKLATSNKVKYLRAGIWKPRTRPNSFEGVGEIGLSWLKAAGEKVGLPVTTEVATAQHVELALKHGIDLLWIGARTTANPFSVQEIANALKGVNIPVLVKNPINPDLELWIGALERINKAGITQLGAIHRGFSSYEKSIYRNQPKWEIPIELMRQYPELLVICDPSHISGKRELLFSVAQQAMDLDMKGLMIESHIDPENAWSDPDQQVTPENLISLIEKIKYRNAKICSSELSDQLEELRRKIDIIDNEIISKLGERMKIAADIGKYKRKNDLTILQVSRWDEILKNRRKLAKEVGLSDEFITKYLKMIHKESIVQQTKIMNKD